jgi:hypothetical protein
VGQHPVFVNIVGERLTDLDLPGRAWTLASVSELQQLGGFDSYAIELTTDTTDPSPQQGMIALEHPQLGRVDLFVVPIAPGRVEAVFNELAGSADAATGTEAGRT